MIDCATVRHALQPIDQPGPPLNPVRIVPLALPTDPTMFAPSLRYHHFCVVPVVPGVQPAWNKALRWNHCQNTSGSSGSTCASARL